MVQLVFLQPLFASSYYTSTLSHSSFWIPYRILKKQQVIKNSLKISFSSSFQTNKQATETLASFDPERDGLVIIRLSTVETVVHTKLPN